ncbi:MAG: hypothetical protein K8S87_03600 [Planctomycetes bacterium]|nr:hypothetical protein [Planctomycetota bacterium]
MNSECNISYFSENIAIISFTGSFIAESALSAINCTLDNSHKDIILDLSGTKRMMLSSIMDFARIKALIEELQGRFIISSPPAIFHLLNASLGGSYRFNICPEISDAIRSLTVKRETEDLSYAVESRPA